MSNSPINLHLGDVLRATAVKRWQIVDVTRQQSLGEHTYAVAVIAMELALRLGLDELVPDVAVAALLHDLPEVVTGDIPTPVKKVLGVSDRLEQIERRLMFARRNYHDYDDQVRSIVKAADLIESILFLGSYGNNNSSHVLSVYHKLVDRLEQIPAAFALWLDIRGHTPAEIDDIIKVDDAEEA